MADKAISELIAAEQITATDMFVLEQNGTAKKLTGQVLLNWLTAAADGHGGIQNIAKTGSNGLEDTYRITLADTTVFDFVVTNGRGISSVVKTSTSGLVDTYTITYSDGTTSTFTVTNGAKGDQGENTYTWIKYASQEPTEASHSMGDVPDNWIGIYYGTSSSAPADWTEYQWFKMKGETGAVGDPATLVSSAVEYLVSDSGTVIPSGSWVTSMPSVAQGKYLWTRVTQNFNTGDPVIYYTVSRMGIDGLGSVNSVAGISPSSDGNVPLTPEDIGAASKVYSDSKLVESVDYPGCFYRIVNGYTEWLNPPMMLGVEYRTTERSNGLSVYIKKISLGTLPVSTLKNVLHGISEARNIISFEAFAINDTNTTQQFPIVNNSGEIVGKAHIATDAVIVASFDDLSSYTGAALLRYTKG